MALDSPKLAYDAPVKDLYAVGEMPPLGHVPAQMYAWAIRRERHGEPDKAMLVEVVDTPEIDAHEVLVLVMATVMRTMILFIVTVMGIHQPYGLADWMAQFSRHSVYDNACKGGCQYD